VQHKEKKDAERGKDGAVIAGGGAGRNETTANKVRAFSNSVCPLWSLKAEVTKIIFSEV
jgi:hypothetical protein